MSTVRLTITAELTLASPTMVRTQLHAIEGATQHVEGTTLTATPPAATLSSRLAEGALATYLHLPAGTSRIQAESVVTLSKPAYLSRRFPSLTWDQAAALIRAVRATGRTGDDTHVTPGEALYMAATSVPSPLVSIDDDARDLAFSTLAPGQPLIVGVAEVAAKIAARGLDAADSTHAFLGAMRAVGIASAYVLGVVPGRGIHPFAAVCIPGFTWFPIDPQASRPVADGTVVLAWGRDAADTPLLRLPDGGDGGATITATVAPQR
ncbi:MAG: transglutaminase family protein [bacterium]|nr:transglutaminase family protein [bacterium]